MDPFYRAFEERHRGPRELIESRLEIYLPFVEPLKTLYETPEILDLGCGRGEWLELMQRNGFQAKGVDLDEGMLLACRELNLDVCQADALDYLRGLAAERLSVVSAFHVVEHIPFETLRQLVAEAHRALKPGGLLILETPNSENLVVGTSSFYLDPTHQRPLPAQLLSFVVEYAGFERVKTLYLQAPPGLASAQQTTLINVLDGVSPDYAVIAQKQATKDVCALFDEPFEHSYGLRLSALAERYDQQTRSHTQWLQNEWDAAKPRIEELSKRTGQLEAELASEQAHGQWLQNEWDAAKQDNTQLQAHAQRLQNEWDAAKQHNNELQVHAQLLQNEWDAAKQHIEELSKSSGRLETELAAEQAKAINLALELNAANEHNTQLQAHAQWLQDEWDAANAKVDELNHSAHRWWMMADQLNKEQQSIYASKFWRLTWPLRKIMQAAKWTLVLPVRTVRWALRLPQRITRSLLHRAMRSGLIADTNITLTTSHSPETDSAPQNTVAAYPPNMPEESIINLSPRAARIYTDLKKAIEARKS